MTQQFIAIEIALDPEGRIKAEANPDFPVMLTWTTPDQEPGSAELPVGGTVTLAAAELPNAPPTTVGNIPAVTAYHADGPIRIDLGPYFNDDGAEPLTYTATADVSSGYAIGDTGELLLALPVAGAFTVEVTATDSEGQTAVQSVSVAFLDRPAPAPITIVTLPKIEVVGGGEPYPGKTIRAVGLVFSGGVEPFGDMWRAFRSNTAISPATASPEYVLTAADIGKPIKMRARRTDSAKQYETATSTNSITAVAAPPIVVTPPDPDKMQPDFIVGKPGASPQANAAALLSATLAAARMRGPRLIALAPGTVFGLVRKAGGELVKDGGADIAQRMTIAPLVRQTKATKHDDLALFLNGGFEIGGWDGFNLENLFFEDTQRTNGYPSTAGAPIQFKNPRNFRARNCHFTGGHRGFTTHVNTTNGLIEWCHFTKCGMDSISFFGVNIDCTIQHNQFDEPDINHAISHNTGRHPDASSMQGPGSKRLKWLSNYYSADTRGYWQAIFATTGSANNGTDVSIDGLIIERNWIDWDNYNAIIVRNAKNISVKDNVIRRKYVTSDCRIQISLRVQGYLGGNIMPEPINYSYGASGSGLIGMDKNKITLKGDLLALTKPDLHGIFGYEAS